SLSIHVRPSPPSLNSNNPPHTEIYTLSLHDALPISMLWSKLPVSATSPALSTATPVALSQPGPVTCFAQMYAPSVAAYLATKTRSEEHTSELQSRFDLVCRLLLEKKKRTLFLHLPVP